MTNQEAIKMLTAKVECIRRETSGTDIDCNLRNCDDCELCYAQGTTGEQRKALNMAISALQAQEAKNSNESSLTQNGLDTISRQDAIDEIRKCRFVVDAIEKIIGLPSAQPEREKGEWTKDCACEICGFKPWYERDIHTLSFCPNCGADMREDQTDDNRPG